MKNYEVIIERLQPSCGGKDPKEVKLCTVSTEDPEAYVREKEPDGEMEVTRRDNGEIVIRVQCGLKTITYTFTED